MKQLMWSRNRPLALRVLVLLLALIVLAASPLNTFCQAHAVAIVDDAALGAVAVIMVLLKAAGYYFENQETLNECAVNLWNGMSGDLKSGILSVASIWLENQGQVNLWKVSASLKDLILQYFGSQYDATTMSFANVYTGQLVGAKYDSADRIYDNQETNVANQVVAILSPEEIIYRDLSTDIKHALQVVKDDKSISVLYDGQAFDFNKRTLFSDVETGYIAPVGWFFYGNNAYGYQIGIKYAYNLSGQASNISVFLCIIVLLIIMVM